MTKTFCDCCHGELKDYGAFNSYKSDSRFLREAKLNLGTNNPVEVEFQLDTKIDVCNACVADEMIRSMIQRMPTEKITKLLAYLSERHLPKPVVTPEPKTIHPPQFSTEGIQWMELQKNAFKAVHKLADEIWTAESKLTREQFKEAILQAIQSGDFMKFVRIENAIVFGGKQQCVTYEPFRRVRELEANKEELNGLLDTAINLLSQVKECTIDCDFSSVSIENLCKNIELFKKRVER
jgi:hypothetical protein